jgi:hypothetical protein
LRGPPDPRPISSSIWTKWVSDLGRYTRKSLLRSGKVYGSDCPLPGVTDQKARIAADGGFVRPCLVVSRKTFDDAILTQGFTPEKVDIFSQMKTHIDVDIFDDWFRDTFISDLIVQRERFSYHGLAVLSMDNCSAHRVLEFDHLCIASGVVPVWFPPHSPIQLQIPDLCIFPLGRGSSFE